jgi:PTH1 family peptidyl-tRNA hydrolase
MPLGFHRKHEEEQPQQAGGRAVPAIALIVGLGNPGAQYAGNRHNVGFWTVNRLARRLDIDIGRHTKVVSVGEGTFEGRPLVLAKPRTFMNDSGRAITELLRRYKLKPQQMLVICDDLDSPVARVRLRPNGGAGGQNGMKSIIGAIGNDFPRLRIGIGRPSRSGQPSYDPEDVANWVLADAPPAQKRQLEEAADYAADCALAVLQEGIEAAMNRFNGSSPGDKPRANADAGEARAQGGRR